MQNQILIIKDFQQKDLLKNFDESFSRKSISVMGFYRRLKSNFGDKIGIVVKEIERSQNVIVMFENKKMVLNKQFLKAVDEKI